MLTTLNYCLGVCFVIGLIPTVLVALLMVSAKVALPINALVSLIIFIAVVAVAFTTFVIIGVPGAYQIHTIALNSLQDRIYVGESRHDLEATFGWTILAPDEKYKDADGEAYLYGDGAFCVSTERGIIVTYDKSDNVVDWRPTSNASAC